MKGFKVDKKKSMAGANRFFKERLKHKIVSVRTTSICDTAAFISTYDDGFESISIIGSSMGKTKT